MAESNLSVVEICRVITLVLVLFAELTGTEKDKWDNYKKFYSSLSHSSGETNSFFVNALWNGMERINRKSLFFQETDRCYVDMKLYKERFYAGERWALEMFDSSSHMQSGFMKGNIADLGDFKECLEVISDEVGSIRGQYCQILSFPHGYTNQIPVAIDWFRITSAICVPDSCKIEDLTSYIRYGVSSMSFDFYLYNCQTEDNLYPTLDLLQKIILIVFTTLASVIAVSTFYEVILKYICLKPEDRLPLMTGSRSSDDEEVGKFKSTMLAFSLYSNGRALLKTDKKVHSIKCIYGLRFISACWVLSIHRMILDPQPLTNMFQIDDEIRKWYRVFQMNAYLFVDLFFLMSGLLVSYNFLKTDQRPKLKIVQFYVHRYIRLTPPVIAVILLMFLMNWFSNGPYSALLNTQTIDHCRENWWATITYVNNFYNNMNKCLIHSWYLSADMQLYLLAPLLLFPLKRWPRCIFPLIFFFLSASMLTAFMTSYLLDLQVGYIGDNKYFERDSTYIYEPFYTRAGPWLLGFGLGILLQSFNRGEYKIKKVFLALGWILALVGILVAYFGIYPFVQHGFIHYSMIDAVYKSTHRSLFALGIGWIIYACYTGHGGWVNGFLSSPVFHPLGRISYCFYLIHPFAQYIQFNQIVTPRLYTDLDQITHIVGDIFYSVILATVLHLAVEAPTLALERVWYRSGGSTLFHRREATNSNIKSEETLVTFEGKNAA